jgi:uncharacterized protein YPO0396
MQPGDLFFDSAQAARDRQMRMTRLQLLNWGTFSGLHDIPIAESGFLFVGRSGSGKSTLLDAIAALLVPPQWLSFNTAAREGDGGRYDRNLASYVRGAWADKKDESSGEIATHYLRSGTTWSALAVELRNGAGRIVSLVQVYWLRGASNRNAEVRKHLMIAERPFSIPRDLEGFDLDVRGLKQRLAEVHHFDKFRPYGERFRRLLSIDNELALKLLHKTQSAKNLGDLNVFLREFMLEPPPTFEVAQRLVDEFAELDGAHQAVVTARRQVETLVPAREAHERSQHVDRELDRLAALVDAMDAYRDGRRVRLLEAVLAKHQVELQTLRERHREQGGARIEELERQQADSEAERTRRADKRDRIQVTCRALDWALPTSAGACAELTARARNEVEGRQEADARLAQARDGLRDEKRDLEVAFVEARREVEAMLRQPSNIPAHMLDLRLRVIEALGLSEGDLPFVGELLQVKETEAPWRGAVERVLHGFGLSMLVDERRYAAVTKYVNETRLGTRLVYYRVGKTTLSAEARPHPKSLINKLEIKTGPFELWLHHELARRFDYVCVDGLRELRETECALTREGQVRHNRSRHEKDDRFAIDDRSRWLLGFDNRERLALYQRRAQELADRIGDLDRRLGELDAQRETRQERLLRCQTLANLEWREIDLASVLDRLDSIARQLAEIREGSIALKELGERIQAMQQRVSQVQTDLDRTRLERSKLTDRLNEHQGELAELDLAIRARPIDTALVQPLDERFAALDTPLTLGNLDAQRNRVERAITAEQKQLGEERNGLVRRIEKRFSDFRREWPIEAADLDDTHASAPEFLKLLSRLERDGLPQHEQRFFDLLKEQSTENLAALNTHISQARKQIYERMELVNAGLAEAEFNPGTHLQIEVADRHLEDVRAFRDQVRRVLEHAWQMDRNQAEARFDVLRELVHNLRGAEAERQRWRNLVLDVRQHVEFIGRELDGEGREVEVYRSGAGKSGGQREKLATTCLAAALRYQLGGSEDELPVYAPVVLDEAFGKADNEFTELAMNIFKKFGFQMIVATPLKSVMTLEPFIGGACFVDITERKRSATLQIEYDAERRRLALPEQGDSSAVPALQ